MEVHHFKLDRITFDPDKCSGKACIRGLRMPVASILAYLASGMTPLEILREWPELEPADIDQALAYAAVALEERVLPLRMAAACRSSRARAHTQVRPYGEPKSS